MTIAGLPEELDSLSVPRYAPRPFPAPLPPKRIFEPPLTCIQVNRGWVAHLLGVLEALQQLDAWTGTDEEIEQAIIDLTEFKLQLMRDCEANGGMAGIQDIRVTDCGLEVTFDGINWILKADIDICADSIVSSRLSTAFRSVGNVFQVDTDGDGIPDLTFNLDIAQGDTTIERPIPETDTYDHIWVACIELLEYLQDSLGAALDKIDATASLAEAVQEVLSSVPGFNMLPFDEVFGFLETCATMTTATIRSFLTPESREEAACEMFCAIIATQDLELTPEILHSWQSDEESGNAGHLATSLTSQTIKDRENISRWKLNLDDPPDNDWESLCGCAPMWSKTFDFTLDDYSEYWAPQYGTSGVYEAGVGWRGAYREDGVTLLTMLSTAAFAALDSFTLVKVEISHYREESANGGSNIVHLDNDANFYPNADAGTHVSVWEGEITLDSTIYIYLHINRTTSKVSRLTKIRLWGTGFNPFV